MKSVAAVVLAFSLLASRLAQAQDPPVPPPPPQAPPAAATMDPPAAGTAPSPGAVQMASPPPPVMAQPSLPDASEEPPSRGVGYLVAGGVFTGLGALNLLTAPLCKTDLVDRSIQNGCLIASLVIGGTFLAIGVPTLIVGAVKRSKFKEWKANHPVAAGLGFAPARGGGSLTLGGRF